MNIINYKVDSKGFIRLYTYIEDIIIKDVQQVEAEMLENERNITEIKAIVPFDIQKKNEEDIYFIEPSSYYSLNVTMLTINYEKKFIFSPNSLLDAPEVFGNFKYVREDLERITSSIIDKIEIHNMYLMEYIFKLLDTTGKTFNKNIKIQYTITQGKQEEYNYYLLNPTKFVSKAFLRAKRHVNLPILTKDALANLRKNLLYSELLKENRNILNFLKENFKIEKDNPFILSLFIDINLKIGELSTYEVKHIMGPTQFPFIMDYVYDSANFLEVNFPSYRTITKEKRKEYIEAIEKKYKVPIDVIYNKRITFDKVHNAIKALRKFTIIDDYTLDCEVY